MNVKIIDVKAPVWQVTLQQLPHDIYHLPEYLLTESKRLEATPEALLISEGEKVFFLPYLLRHGCDIFPDELIEENIIDVISPYGYPGILLSKTAASNPEFINSAIHELKDVLKIKGICSAFFRLHPILNQNINQILPTDTLTFNGETVYVDLRLSVEEIKQQTRKNHRSNIAKCKRLGWNAKVVAFPEYLDEFMVIYEETMNRVEAKKSYYFSREYFQNLSKLGDRIHLCIVEKEGRIGSAGIYLECDGIVQSHLGGSVTEFLHESPFSLVYDYGRYWAKERNNKFFSLGGGVGGSNTDSLYTFKSGFSKTRHNFFTIRLITDEEKYYHLTELKASYLNIETETLLNSNFFPAYRSPN